MLLAVTLTIEWGFLTDLRVSKCPLTIDCARSGERECQDVVVEAERKPEPRQQSIRCSPTEQNGSHMAINAQSPKTPDYAFNKSGEVEVFAGTHLLEVFLHEKLSTAPARQLSP
jgi:hypothetical protein